MKLTLFKRSLCCLIILYTLPGVQPAFSRAEQQSHGPVEIWDLFEIAVPNNNHYDDPYGDVELVVEFRHRNTSFGRHFGFYDGEGIWKVRFTPRHEGRWFYKATFSDGSGSVEGDFNCIPGSRPGAVRNNPHNPFWLCKGHEYGTQFRSFHVGDRFFAENWDDPDDPGDGNPRTLFLDWLQEHKYNMLSVASHYTNREEEGRGKGWDTPALWPLNVTEFRKMEAILDDLHQREITLFPFAGFFGARGNWPTDPGEQEQYIKYILARIGHYPNIILSVAGPEPFWREDSSQYKGAMRLADIRRLGSLIDSLDIHDHVVTVHNEKRATLYGDPFIDEPWMNMSTLQGPTTLDRDQLFSGLSMNHRPQKACYAQETLWAGNKFHPDYSLDDIRRNTLCILFSGSILNFADMDGNSSSGFSGTMDLDHQTPEVHRVVGEVWDWFETIPFYRLVARQDLVRDRGYCLAEEGVEYYVYLAGSREVELHLDFPYHFRWEWISAIDPGDVRPGELANGKTRFEAPGDGDDWILHVYAPRPYVVATGHFPDMATDAAGNLHLVYNRDGLRYMKYDAAGRQWSEELEVGCPCENVQRSDPDIVVDSQGRPHLFCGNAYAWYDGTQWNRERPEGTRDTELAIDSRDRLYLVSRGGNNGGYVGLERKENVNAGWKTVTSPDTKGPGPNNHVYSDLWIDTGDRIHHVQRHGPRVEVTYRRSSDGGKTWPIEEDVMDDRQEAPHITVNSEGNVFISTGSGYIVERDVKGHWKQHGRRLHVHARMQPELGIDRQDNIYQTAFGGLYNILYRGTWNGENIIHPVTGKGQVGFVETAGSDGYAFVVWEEGEGNPDEGLKEDACILVGRLWPDGRLVGLVSE